MLLSLVLTTYQDARELPRAIAHIHTLRSCLPYEFQVIVVDRGSTDRSTALCNSAGFSVLLSPSSEYGDAVRMGMLNASGTYRILIDVTWSIPASQLQLLLPPIQSGFDITIASRRVEGATRDNEPISALAFSRVFNRLVRALVLTNQVDTQLTYKCFRAEAAYALFSRSREQNETIHVEVLAIAEAFRLNIVEVPVDWTFHPDNPHTSVLDSPALLASLLRIRTRLSTDQYAPIQMRSEQPNTPRWSL